MRGPDIPQAAMFIYLTLERRIPADHLLRSIRRLSDGALASISGELDKLYSWTGRESIPPERVFGWAKRDRPLQQIKLRGLKRVDGFYRWVVTAYNLMRMGRLIPISE
jgi:hypothetical protein